MVAQEVLDVLPTSGIHELLQRFLFQHCSHLGYALPLLQKLKMLDISEQVKKLFHKGDVISFLCGWNSIQAKFLLKNMVKIKLFPFTCFETLLKPSERPPVILVVQTPIQKPYVCTFQPARTRPLQKLPVAHPPPAECGRLTHTTMPGTTCPQLT